MGKLAASIGQGASVEVPANRITGDCEAITPDLLPLVAPSQSEIDDIVSVVPGGTSNIQDIYPPAHTQTGLGYKIAEG